ncbi:MAG: histidine kinase [Bacteroidota bacterium]
MDFKQLFKVAAISSPVLAIYGLVPVFLFNEVDNVLIAQGISYLSIVCFFLWLVNIFVIRLTQPHWGWPRYVLSYAITMLFILFFSSFLDQIIQDRPIKTDIYPYINGAAINTIILIISTVLLLNEKKKNAELKVQQLHIENIEARQQLLLQQFQPHFLFNALSTLKSLLHRHPDEAENYLLKLSDFLRFSVQANQHSVVSLAKEMSFTRQYLEMQQIRFEDAIFCNWSIPDALYDAQIPVFSLQSLVENAIKHNRFSKEHPLRIEIKYQEDHISIRNNKWLKSGVETSGTGLSSLSKRYEVLTGFPIFIEDQNNEFLVRLKLLTA